MSELASTVKEALAALAASDRKHLRFGAAAHHYELATPTAVVVPELPEDMAAFIQSIGRGGAGPGYGWFPVEAAIDHLIPAPPHVTAYTKALPICHLGCGYAAVVPLDGPARGELWLDARAIGIVEPKYGSFTGFYLGWIDALAHNAWPADFIPPGLCSVAAAMSGYFGVIEKSRGLPEGTLTGDQLRAALMDLGPRSIQIGAEEGPLFDKGDTVDPCLTCARMLDNLAAEGLRRDVLAPGVPAKPGR